MLDTTLTDRNGNTIMANDQDPATIRTALYMAIDAQVEGDDKMDPTTKLKLAKLSLKLADPKAELSAGEIIILTERAGKVLSTLIYAQVLQTLDPKALG